MNYTPKQLQILKLIYQYQSEHGFAPTYAELAKNLGVSTITVFEHLEALERKGAIRRRRHEARSVEIIEPNFLRDQPNRKTVPLRGLLEVGRPIEKVEVPDELPIGEVFGNPGNTFALRVKGNSLAENHILDGDLIVLEGRESAAEGEMALALLEDGSAVFKRSPIAGEKIRIQGVFKGVVRRTPQS